MLWDIAICVLTVISIRRKELSTRSQLSSALMKQGTGYVFTAVLTSVPMAASLFFTRLPALFDISLRLSTSYN
jgi:hypothetical protein